jgi:hypothetical protein
MHLRQISEEENPLNGALLFHLKILSFTSIPLKQAI